MSNSAVEKVEPLPFFVMVTEKCERGQDALHTIKHVGANKSQQDKSESQPQDKSAQINVEVTAESDNVITFTKKNCLGTTRTLLLHGYSYTICMVSIYLRENGQ